MSGQLYFIFRNDDGSFYGGPFRDEDQAMRMAKNWTELDGTSATVLGVPTTHLAIVEFHGVVDRAVETVLVPALRYGDAACCDLHGRNCEPPSELCCHNCTEASHDTWPIRHADGTVCSAPDLSRSAHPGQTSGPAGH